MNVNASGERGTLSNRSTFKVVNLFREIRNTWFSRDAYLNFNICVLITLAFEKSALLEVSCLWQTDSEWGEIKADT